MTRASEFSCKIAYGWQFVPVNKFSQEAEIETCEGQSALRSLRKPYAAEQGLITRLIRCRKCHEIDSRLDLFWSPYLWPFQ